MNIRFAEEKDLEAIYELYKHYTGDNIKQYNVILNKEKITENIRSFVMNKCGLVAEVNGEIVGGLAGIITPCLFTNDVMFMSMFLYFPEKHRKYVVTFIKGVEEILERTNVTRLVVANPAFENADKMDRFYTMLGFQKLETHYVKAV